jgi:hypothetical protein
MQAECKDQTAARILLLAYSISSYHLECMHSTVCVRRSIPIAPPVQAGLGFTLMIDYGPRTAAGEAPLVNLGPLPSCLDVVPPSTLPISVGRGMQSTPCALRKTSQGLV